VRPGRRCASNWDEGLDRGPGTVESMSTFPLAGPAAVVVIPDDYDALVPLDEWLTLLADDEDVTLPQPAARYLEEAREIGEV